MQHKNRGITLIGFLMLLCVLGFFAYLAMRLIPVYVEYFGVVKSLETVKNEPGAATKSVDEIRREVSVLFDTQYVDTADVPVSAIQVKREAGASTLRVAYERRVSFLYNIDLLVSFDKSVNLSAAGGD